MEHKRDPNRMDSIRDAIFRSRSDIIADSVDLGRTIARVVEVAAQVLPRAYWTTLADYSYSVGSDAVSFPEWLSAALTNIQAIPDVSALLFDLRAEPGHFIVDLRYDASQTSQVEPGQDFPALDYPFYAQKGSGWHSTVAEQIDGLYALALHDCEMRPSAFEVTTQMMIVFIARLVVEQSRNGCCGLLAGASGNRTVSMSCYDDLIHLGAFCDGVWKEDIRA